MSTILTDIKAIIVEGKIVIVETLTTNGVSVENLVSLSDVGGLKGYLNGSADFDCEDLKNDVVED